MAPPRPAKSSTPSRPRTPSGLRASDLAGYLQRILTARVYDVAV
jgi:hypothetical protein